MRKQKTITHDKIEDLILYRKTQALLAYTYQRLANFPKRERMGLTMDIKNRTVGIYDLVIRVAMAKDKLPILQKLNLELKLLKGMVRLAYWNRYIKVRNLEAWATKLTEINNIVVGWGSKWEKL
jgi:hypothetical protein